LELRGADGGSAVNSYRCYFFSGDSHIVDVEVIDCDSDEGALLAAIKLLETRSHRRVEVWDRARKVFPQSRNSFDLRQMKQILRAAGLMILDVK
jgi:hypothetical protein